jgi:diguanylate cyclase (GGDEF)-like protein
LQLAEPVLNNHIAPCPRYLLLQPRNPGASASIAGNLLQCVAVCIALVLMTPAQAALSVVERETQSLERAVADSPRAALRDAEAQLELAGKSGDKKLELGALRLIVMACLQTEDLTRLASVIGAAEPLATAAGDLQAMVEFKAARGTLLAGEVKYLEAQKVFDEAIAMAEKAGLKRAAATVLLSKAYVAGLLGRDTESLEMYFKAHQRFEEIGDAMAARATLGSIGAAYAHDGASNASLQKALTFHERSIAPDSEKTARHELATTYFNIAVVYQRLKDWPKAKEFVTRSKNLFHVLDDTIGEAFCSYRLGVLAGETGEWGQALAHQNAALPVLTGSGDTTMIFNVQRNRARALARLGKRREAQDALAAANKIRGSIDSSWMETAYLADAADVAANLGDFEAAYRTQRELHEVQQKAFNEARERDAAEMQARFEVKQTDAENELLRVREREAEARGLAQLLAITLLLIVLGALGWYLFRQRMQNQRFADLALRDDLTSLPNRRAILEFARAQIRASHGSLGSSARLCLALIDIDHFKSINDDCGHAIGDAVLVAFAAVCGQQLRSIDRLGRFGGEEFMLIMPGADLSQVPQMFNRLREAVAQLRVNGVAPEKRLTFSMGVTELAAHDDDLEKMTKRADDALYRAKQGGRDRYETG